MATRGYPGDYTKGSEIGGLETAAAEPGVAIFHAGTKRDGKRILYVHDGRASIVLEDGTQMHFGSLGALEAFCDRLGELAYQARQAQPVEVPA